MLLLLLLLLLLLFCVIIVVLAIVVLYYYCCCCCCHGCDFTLILSHLCRNQFQKIWSYLMRMVMMMMIMTIMIVVIIVFTQLHVLKLWQGTLAIVNYDIIKLITTTVITNCYRNNNYEHIAIVIIIKKAANYFCK